MEKYKIIKTLGDGAFGVVYKATNTATGEVVAIKKFKQKYKNWEECVELREVKSLRKMNNKYIIKLIEVLQVNDDLYLVFEYLQYNLYELYSKSKQNKKKLTQNQIRNIVFQVASGLAYMHKNGFFHRDMKPQNLLIYNNVVKICDFGLARQIRSRPPYTQYVSTRWYRAPELLLRSNNYNSPIDIFALGCIMAELYMQSPLFPGNNQLDQMNKIVKILGTPDKAAWPEGYKLANSRGYFFPEQKKMNLQDIITNASPEAIDLIEQMLQYQSRKRPTAQDILRHPYFEGYKQTEEQSQISLDFVQPKKMDLKKEELLKSKQNFRKTIKIMNEQDDLDSILKELEEKNKKSKLPNISSKGIQPEKKQLRESKLRESKTQIKPVFRHMPESRNFMKFQSQKRQDDYVFKLPVLKKQNPQQLFANKLNYNFQPSIQRLPQSKYGRPLGLNGAINPIQRINGLKQRQKLFPTILKPRNDMLYGLNF